VPTRFGFRELRDRDELSVHHVAAVPEREVALLAEAGFGDARLFYAGLWVYGWIARL
jgi:hypothetical protein